MKHGDNIYCHNSEINVLLNQNKEKYFAQYSTMTGIEVLYSSHDPYTMPTHRGQIYTASNRVLSRFATSGLPTYTYTVHVSHGTDGSTVYIIISVQQYQERYYS